jgi:hypothetical protein
MSLVGSGHNLVLDYEMYNCKIDSSKKDEGELNVSKRLLTRVISSSLASTIKISYEISNLTNSEKGIKFVKKYNFNMAPFLIRLYQKRGHLN